MKKKLSILFIFLMIASSFAFAGCSKGGDAPAADSQNIGVWKATKGVYKDEEVAIEDVLTDTNGVFELELQADGTATITVDSVETGTWTESSDAVHVKFGEADTEFKIEGDTLCFELQGFKIVFEKQ